MIIRKEINLNEALTKKQEQMLDAMQTRPVQTDEDIKKSAELALNDMGLSMSAAITIFLKKVGREHRIPFEITAGPFYSESNIRYLSKIIDGIENGTRPLVEHELIEADEMKLKWDEDAWCDYLYWQTQDKKTLKKINAILTDIMRSPFDGIGKPELLKYYKSY